MEIWQYQWIWYYKWDGIGIYRGNWLDGKKHGQGTMVWDDGSKYEGGWVLDEFNGDGTYYYNNGDIYVGEWKNGKNMVKEYFLGNLEMFMKVIGLKVNDQVLD